MRDVIGSLVPILIMSMWVFGVIALLMVAVTGATAVVTERLVTSKRSLHDGSALLTGLLLGFVLPPGLPLWMGALGSAFAVGLGKAAFGGLGANIFNPALLGRAFLQAAFPEAMTTWVAPQMGFWQLPERSLAWPLMGSHVDGISAATPLGGFKFQGLTTDLSEMVVGTTAGSLGETATWLLVLCGLWLALRKAFDWRLPVSTLFSVALLSWVLHATVPERCADPMTMLGSGGLMFAAVFMVTDPVTTPVTAKGMWLFGFGTGVLVVLIRSFGGLPEGVMYAVLLMNAVTPWINRFTQPRVFGGLA